MQGMGLLCSGKPVVLSGPDVEIKYCAERMILVQCDTMRICPFSLKKFRSEMRQCKWI